MKAKKNLTSSPYFEYQTFLKSKNEVGSIKNSNYYLDKYSFEKRGIDIIPCAVYIINYQTQENLFVSDGCKNILGHSPDEFIKNGFALQAKHFHPEDSTVMSNKIFKKFIAYCKSLPLEELKNSRFSINYRYLKEGNIYAKILQQYVVLETDKDRNPLLTMGICTDITTQKPDDKIIFSISQYNEKGELCLVSTESFFNTSEIISKKETEVLKYIIQGLNSTEIAEKLKISFYTVKAHRRSILEKTNCKNSPELISYALKNGIV